MQTTSTDYFFMDLRDTGLTPDPLARVWIKLNKEK